MHQGRSDLLARLRVEDDDTVADLMPTDGDGMSRAHLERWHAVLSGVAAALVPGPRLVLVDGHEHSTVFADRLCEHLTSVGQPSLRLSSPSFLNDGDGRQDLGGLSTIAIADGAVWQPPDDRWDTMIWLRTAGPQPEHDADMVVDLSDPTWPVIRHINPSLADRRTWHLNETRAFFAVRAATWDAKFGDDLPAYAQAVADMGIPAGTVAIDVGCGTGRALPALRAATGTAGVVIGIDVTEQMLAAARDHGRSGGAHLVLADAGYLPLPDASVDAVFTAGLIGHVPDVDPTLRELARVTREGGRLALFHPSGRAALAARHGRSLRPDEALAERSLGDALGRTGWRAVRYDDAVHRFLALATRVAR